MQLDLCLRSNGLSYEITLIPDPSHIDIAKRE
jgi:hypothetical protein